MKFDWLANLFAGLALVCIVVFLASFRYGPDVTRDLDALPALALIIISVFHVNGLEDSRAKAEMNRLWMYFSLLSCVQFGLESLRDLTGGPSKAKTILDGVIFATFAICGAVLAFGLRKKNSSRESPSKSLSI